MSRRTALALVAVGLLGSRPAAAQPVADELPPGRWYGWQMMAADAAATALLFAPVSERLAPLARGMGMTTLLMDAPIIHMAHRNSRSASISLVRLPFLLLGRFLGSFVGDLVCSEVDCANTAPVVGSAVGIAPVVLYDWVTARRPGQLFYASGAPAPRPPVAAPPPAELASGRLPIWGWRRTLPVVGGTF
jgi:hypothetical protein